MARSYTLSPPAAHQPPDFAAELNSAQLAAVTAPPGPSLVIAGAGSGKTRTLTYRVAWLLTQGVPPSSILLLTFTNKAAREMLERVAQLVPEAVEGIWGGTFHSIGLRILRRHAAELGFTAGFSILDREDQEELLEAVVARAGYRGAEENFPKADVLAEVFSYSINTLRPLAEVILQRYRYFYRFREDLEKLQSLFEARKRENNVMDFDDLVAKPLALFLEREDIAMSYQRRFRHILVDEYQDTNALQARWVDLLAAHHRSLMVVGDDAQAIYSWRGADCTHFLDFPQRYPEATVYKIETNYRSVPSVLQLANASIAHNPAQFPKNLHAVRPDDGHLPAVVRLATNNQQAAFIAQRVLELYGEGIPFAEMAVLYRAHFHSMEIQFEFTRRGIPYHITSGLRFFEQAHVKDVAAHLKFAVNPRDETAFKRLVRLVPGVGVKTAETLWQQVTDLLAGEPDFAKLHDLPKIPAKAHTGWHQLVYLLEELVPPGQPQPPQAMIQAILRAGYLDYVHSHYTNGEQREDDLRTLAEFAGEFSNTEDFLAQLALLSAVDTGGVSSVQPRAEEQDTVTLSSIHQAKGLEWRVVFVPWLTEGAFPGSRSLENPAALPEERRLFYVAVTRCRDELYLTYPQLRLNAKMGPAPQRPSRFLAELPETLWEPWEVQSFGPEAGTDGSTDEDIF